MPTVTVEGSVTLQQAATALQGKLGSLYEITTHGSGIQQALKVEQPAASTATVHLDQDGNATTFHVHGGGLIISRIVNEFGIAKKVAATIAEAFQPIPPADHRAERGPWPEHLDRVEVAPASESWHEETDSLAASNTSAWKVTSIHQEGEI
ncbi:MAG: hypothetical protein WAK82_15520 [Streptosporangiaceae bacterium]